MSRETYFVLRREPTISRWVAVSRPETSGAAEMFDAMVSPWTPLYESTPNDPGFRKPLPSPYPVPYTPMPDYFRRRIIATLSASTEPTASSFPSVAEKPEGKKKNRLALSLKTALRLATGALFAFASYATWEALNTPSDKRPPNYQATAVARLTTGSSQEGSEGFLGIPPVKVGDNRYSVSVPEAKLTISNLRILRGDERGIFNVDEQEAQAATPDKPGPDKPGRVIIIVPNTVQKALEKPSPKDDEITQLVRSYLTPEILSELNTLPIHFVMFPTKGPEGEKIKPEFASLWGWYEANFVISYRDAYSFFPNNHRFDRKGIKDLRDLERLSNINEFKKGWRLLIAKQLLEYGANGQNSGIEGFLVNNGEITDVIVQAKSAKTHPVVNNEAFIKQKRSIQYP